MADLLITDKQRHDLLHAYETLVIRALSLTDKSDETAMFRAACLKIKHILAGVHDGDVLRITHPGDREWPIALSKNITEALK